MLTLDQKGRSLIAVPHEQILPFTCKGSCVNKRKDPVANISVYLPRLMLTIVVPPYPGPFVTGALVLPYEG